MMFLSNQQVIDMKRVGKTINGYSNDYMIDVFFKKTKLKH